MKVWELEEGKEYVVVGKYSKMSCDKYKVNCGILESFLYDEWRESSWSNRIDILKDVEFELHTQPADWSKVEVDAKILVRDFETSSWIERHFATYDNGIVYAWSDGMTSFTVCTENKIVPWKYATLYK